VETYEKTKQPGIDRKEKLRGSIRKGGVRTSCLEKRELSSWDPAEAQKGRQNTGKDILLPKTRQADEFIGRQGAQP